jgi:Family of unknown function (DUF6582)
LPVRRSTTEVASMAELTTKKRDSLRDSSFAYIDREGERHLPINDADHVRNAISRFNQTDFESKTAKHSAARRILAAAKRHDIEVDDASDVAKAAKS